MIRLISVTTAALALAASGFAQNPRALFQDIYTRIDAAVAAKDQAAIDRLIAADAQMHVGPLNVSLRGMSASEIAKAGLSRRTEVKEAVVEGKSAVVTVDILYIIGTKQDGHLTARDRWEQGDAGWICRESERTAGESTVQPTSAEEAKPVIAELKARAVNLATMQTGAGFEDLEAFGKAVGDARIVALGEATHGTREFFLLNRRLIEYLAQRKGFTVVAFEMNWPDSNAVDRYIKNQDGPPPLVGDRGTVEWMRAGNRAGAHLTWTGFDMQGVGQAADMAVAYLRRVAPETATAAGEAYAAARKIDDDHANVFLAGADEAARRAEPIVAQFDAHRAEWVAKTSAAEWRDARHAAATVVDAAAMRVQGNGPQYRDRMMAQNVEWLADQAYPGQKIILWAHNGHVAAETDQMGGWLRRRFGDAYYVVGTAYRRGEIWAYGIDGTQNKGFGAWPVATAPEGSGDAVLSAAGMPLFFLDVRSVPREGPLGAWLAAEHRFNVAGSVVLIGKENMDAAALRELYDGLVFIEESHAGLPAQ